MSPYITGQQQRPVQVGRGVLTSFCPPQLSLELNWSFAANPGWTKPGLGPLPASLPSLLASRLEESGARGSQKQALSPDHHTASPAGPRGEI